MAESFGDGFWLRATLRNTLRMQSRLRSAILTGKNIILRTNGTATKMLYVKIVLRSMDAMAAGDKVNVALKVVSKNSVYCVKKSDRPSNLGGLLFRYLLVFLLREYIKKDI